jgi:glycerophosphoryl diester phosphodiesterase
MERRKIMKNRMVRIFIGVLIPVIALLLLGSFFSKSAADRPFYDGSQPRMMVYAHMGGDRIWPGDTLYAYDQSAKLGVDAFDMDAHITKDGQIVLLHDESVDRTTDGIGLVENKTLAELKQLDAAYKWSLDDGKTYPFRGQGIQVPTLGEVFAKYPNMRYLVEIKLTKTPIAVPFCDLIHKYNMQDKVIVASFHDDAMRLFRESCPDVATSASKSEVLAFVILSKIGLSGLISPIYQSLQVPYDTSESYGIPIITEGFIKAAHSKNIKVETWTLDDPELLKQYMNWGIDGVDTDRPDLMMPIAIGNR